MTAEEEPPVKFNVEEEPLVVKSFLEVEIKLAFPFLTTEAFYLLVY